MNDEQAFEVFEKVNRSKLDQFSRLLARDEVSLILLSVNPQASYTTERTAQNIYNYTIHRLNEILRRFALEKGNVYYLDVHAFLNQIKRKYVC